MFGNFVFKLEKPRKFMIGKMKARNKELRGEIIELS